MTTIGALMIFEGWIFIRLAQVFFRLFGVSLDFIYTLKQDFTKIGFFLDFPLEGVVCTAGWPGESTKVVNIDKLSSGYFLLHSRLRSRATLEETEQWSEPPSDNVT